MKRAFPHRMVFIRHGETAFNASGRLQGQRDIPLNARGREQASSVGRRLSDMYGSEIVRLDVAGEFWASPLGRTRETMEIARGAMGLERRNYKIDDRLKELTFGEWEGLTWREVEKIDAAGVRARKANKWDFTPPGGESYAMLAMRVHSWLEERDDDCFVSAHGGVARALLFLIGGLAKDAAEGADIWQGRALIFEDGGFTWVG
jgi:broad specificity phosphatase PhoE